MKEQILAEMLRLGYAWVPNEINAQTCPFYEQCATHPIKKAIQAKFGLPSPTWCFTVGLEVTGHWKQLPQEYPE